MEIPMPDTAISAGLAALVTISGLILSWQKIVKNAKKEREEQAAKILQAAKEEDALLKAKLEARVEKIDLQLKTLELNVNKDIGHLKETYAAEIKVLGEKIEALRDELRDQHSQMVTLLSKLIETK
jgi:uncharacterized membrane protein